MVKGQAVFEFVVAAVIFFGIIFYMITFLDYNVATYSYGSKMNNLEAKAMEVSEFLLHVNLSEEWPVLSYDSIEYLNQTCNDDYAGMLESFDVGENGMKILVSENGTYLMDCLGVEPVPDLQRSEVDRFAVSENGSIMNMKVIVW